MVDYSEDMKQLQRNIPGNWNKTFFLITFIIKITNDCFRSFLALVST